MTKQFIFPNEHEQGEFIPTFLDLWLEARKYLLKEVEKVPSDPKGWKPEIAKREKLYGIFLKLKQLIDKSK